MQGDEGESAPEGDDKSEQQTDDKGEQKPGTKGGDDDSDQSGEETSKDESAAGDQESGEGGEASAEEGGGEQDDEEAEESKPDIKVGSVPYDPRFPGMNQVRKIRSHFGLTRSWQHKKDKMRCCSLLQVTQLTLASKHMQFCSFLHHIHHIAQICSSWHLRGRTMYHTAMLQPYGLIYSILRPRAL